MSGDKVPPLMMIMIRHLTHFNLSRSFVMLLPDCIDTALNTPAKRPFLIFLNFDIAPITTTDMEGNETRDSKQCKCHVGGGPGG